MIPAGLLLIALLAALLIIGAPIAVALGLSASAAILAGLDMNAMGAIATTAYSSIAKYPLIAIPLFILTGIIFERSGVARHLVTFAQAIIGPRRGGLALVAVMVSLIMGGMSGSGPADAAAVAAIMLPSMSRAGYPRPFSASVIAASASTAILIPPSIALIIYSIIVPGLDLRALFAAGLIPGLLAGGAIVLPVLYLSRRHDFGRGEDMQWPPFWPSFRRAVPGLLAPVIILGGMRSGLFTPTEAAAVAVAYGLIVGSFIYRSLTPAALYRAFADAAEITATITIVIALAGIFAWVGSTLGAFDAAAKSILNLTANPHLIMAMIMALLLVAGMILDGVSIYLITLPILVPIATSLGWNLTWFGVLMAMNIAIGQFTPPLAVNLIVTAKVGEISIESTVPWVLWLVAAMIGAMALVIAFPELALWLPRVLGYNI